MTIASRSPLSDRQRRIVERLVSELAGVDGVEAVALGGSYATGFATPESDIDLGLLYSETAPFSIDRIRALAERCNDASAPTVSDFYEWGRWVNGGAWLTLDGQRVDLLYRCAEHFERVIADAEAGRFETDFEQMPPFGFFGPVYLGELRACVPLHDPRGRLAALRERVADYPDALRAAIVDSRLWAVEFGLTAFASKYAARGESWLTAAALARFVHQLAAAVFALNRVYPVNDKTALAQLGELPIAPSRFRERVEGVLAAVGRDPDRLTASVGAIGALFDETVALAGDLYAPRALP